MIAYLCCRRGFHARAAGRAILTAARGRSGLAAAAPEGAGGAADSCGWQGREDVVGCTGAEPRVRPGWEKLSLDSFPQRLPMLDCSAAPDAALSVGLLRIRRSVVAPRRGGCGVTPLVLIVQEG